MRWALRMMAILLATGLADAAVVLFTARPFPWVVLIPALLPLLTVVVVVIPMIKAPKARGTRP